jgi:hypothetical protein
MLMQMREFRIRSEIGFFVCVCLAGLCPRFATEQELPIAIVPVGTAHVSGNLVIAGGKASIIKSGSVTASTEPVLVALPHRGDLKICATTTVGLMTDSSVPAAPSEDGDENTRGLMLTFDRGALEASFATVKNSDLILTPDFRILISGPGTAQVQVRLGARGDTCVDNRGPNAPYVTVSSVFGGGAYRVQPDQRVMFQRGSLHEVVDNEKESCGCPPEGSQSPQDNAFPVAQSEGLAPLPAPLPNALEKGVQSAQATADFGYDGSKSALAREQAAEPPAPPPHPAKHKMGFFARLGRFFRDLFGG